MFDLSGKMALVTGAATGLGQALAIAFAKNGAEVAIMDRDLNKLAETESLIQQAGRRTLKIKLDVRELAQIQSGVIEVEKTFGRIDILVNNAGINRPAPGLEVELDIVEIRSRENPLRQIGRIRPHRGSGGLSRQ